MIVPNTDTLSHEEIAALSVASKPLPDLHDFVLLTLLTGMRVGEIEFLKWTDVDLTARSIRVSAPRNRAVRYLPIPRELETALISRRERQLQPEEYVFGPHPPTATAQMRKQLQKISKQFGRAVQLRTMRQTFLHRLVAAGMDILSVCYLGGYSTQSLPVELIGRHKV